MPNSIGTTSNNKRDHLLFTLLVYTGIRRGELCRLEWKDIKEDVVIIRKAKNYLPRIIPICPKLKDILSEYQKGVGHIFNLAEDYVYKGIKRYLRKAGVGHIRVHDLRHTFASHLIMAGVDLKTVQELLGHTSYNTTFIYAHLTDAHLKRAVEKLPY